jgi:hypothetical protein
MVLAVALAWRHRGSLGAGGGPSGTGVGPYGAAHHHGHHHGGGGFTGGHGGGGHHGG